MEVQDLYSSQLNLTAELGYKLERTEVQDVCLLLKLTFLKSFDKHIFFFPYFRESWRKLSIH